MDGAEANRCERCEQLAARVAQLESDLAGIRDQLAKANKNSATSSKPPSDDIKFLCEHPDEDNRVYGTRLREHFRKLFRTIARRDEFASETTFRHPCTELAPDSDGHVLKRVAASSDSSRISQRFAGSSAHHATASPRVRERLRRKVYGDASQSDEARAIALCWLCHLVADLHQPCHAGGLYSARVFPEGDRGANSIRVTNGRNLHAVWDGLLGRNARPRDVQRRVAEFTGHYVFVLVGLRAVEKVGDMDPALWVQESREAAQGFVYTPEVLEAVNAVERGLTDRVETLTLSEEYLQNAARVAQYRAAQAAARLAKILAEAKQPAGSGREALSQGHAHNDYLHVRPLFDALENGFSSVEADIFLVDGELLGAHEASELTRERTLEGLYLEPLREIVENNGGHVHERGHEFQLLVDIKSNGEATYTRLSEMLTEYREILTEVTEGVVTRRGISVVISGNRPVDLISSQSTRLAAIDGRLSDLDSDAPAHLIPLISDRWTSHFTWRGEGEFPESERVKLERIVQQAHAAQRKVRFWATPDNEGMWSALCAAGVDFINTDDLSGLASYLEKFTDEQAEGVNENGPSHENERRLIN